MADRVRRHYRKPERNSTPADAVVNYVYRLYASDGTVLYIGRSMRPFERLRAHHASGAEWAARVTGIDIWGPYNWADVLRNERDAITAERPIGNKEFVINKTHRLPELR